MQKRKQQKKVKHRAPANTVNGVMIRDLMIAHKIDGHFKDHVIIAGARLLDWQATWDIKFTDDKGLAAEDCEVITGAMAVVHKRRLHKILGPDVAANFWRPGIGRVTRETPKKPPNIITAEQAAAMEAERQKRKEEGAPDEQEMIDVVPVPTPAER